MITLPEDVVIAAAAALCMLGSIIGLVTVIVFTKWFPAHRGHTCPHCQSTRVKFITDWHAETVKDEEGLSQTTEEFLCLECKKGHWL